LQLSALRDAWKRVEVAGAVVYGVNPAAAASHSQFASKLSLPFPLLTDTGGRICRRYRAGLWLFVRRTVYVISAEGRVQAAWRGAPEVDEILAALPPA
jgi:peroxiredoxin Q/BCP